MILIEDHTNEDLDALAKEHYTFLNPTKKNGDFTSASLIGKIRSAMADDAGDATKTLFWKYLTDNDFRNLQRIIIGRPNELEIVIGEINTIIGANFISINKGYDNAELTEFGKRIQSVFDYSLRYRQQEFSKAHFKKLSLGFCPYCNETGVNVIVITDPMTSASKSRALLEVDHFFPQVRYPYFALSYFNLIPSCPYCNGSFKAEKNFTLASHFNPFHKRFDDHFVFYLINPIIATKDDIIIGRKALTGHPDNACTDFAIIERYNVDSIKEEIFQGYNLIRNRPNKLVQGLSSMFAAVFPTFSYDDVVIAFNAPTVRSEIASKRLGKLKRDVCKDLGIIA
jgi:hypothetical protein